MYVCVATQQDLKANAGNSMKHSRYLKAVFHRSVMLLGYIH